MLSYQHGFHAGNFADVHKHSTLVVLLAALNRKAKPWSYLETHAGAAFYDLTSVDALKTGEFKQGIEKIWHASAMPQGLSQYVELVTASNSINAHSSDTSSNGVLSSYPGSPLLAMKMKRDADKLSVMELHPTEHQKLKRFFRAQQNISVHHRDGYEGVLSLLPPKPNRGLVLIDPSFEVKAEYQQAADQLIKMQAKWPNGSFALWYPLLAAERHKSMIDRIISSGMRRIYSSEFYMKNSSNERMFGSGMLLVNPPWQVEESITENTLWLQQNLSDQDAKAPKNIWLVSE